ncbi:MAG: MFS transporter [Burkholderiales bacterium]
MPRLPVQSIRPWAALGVVGLGASIAPLDFSVNIIFPAMAAAFELQPTDIRWAAIGLVLTYGSLMLVFGALGDRVGHLRVFRAGLALAIVAFSLCTWAPSFAVLLVGRVLQGISVALVLSCAPALATRVFAESERTVALGAYGSLNAAAGVLAPVIGGLSLLTVGWQGVFAIRIPIMALAFVASGWLARALRPIGASRGPDRTSDSRWAATGWLALGLGLILLAPALLGELGRPQAAWIAGVAVLSAVAGALLLLQFSRAQRSSARPFLPPTVTRHRPFWTLQLGAVLVQFASFSVPLIAPFALLGELSAGPLASGALMATWAMGTLAGSALTPRLTTVWGSARCTQVALWSAAIGLIMVALWPHVPGMTWMLASLALQGAALGLFQVAYGDQVIASLPAESRGVAGSLTMVTRTVGLVFGASIWIALLRTAGFETVYWGAAASLVIFGLLTLRLRHWSIAP